MKQDAQLWSRLRSKLSKHVSYVTTFVFRNVRAQTKENGVFKDAVQYLESKMFRGGKVLSFSRIVRQSRNYYAKNGLILLNFK